MSHVFFAAKATTGRGTNYETPDLKKGFQQRNPVIFITGTFTSGSAKVEISMDGTTWFDYGSAKTAVGFWEIEYPFPYINVNITDATTVSLTATLET